MGPMTEEELLSTALDQARSQPGAEIYEFAPGWQAAKAGGKWFMLTTVRGHRMVIVKAHPEDGAVLRKAFEFITPGYHMNKKHWITINPDPALDKQLVLDLIEDSYLAVKR